MNKYSSVSQLSNVNVIQQGQQSRNSSSQMIQPRNKFHDLPLLFRHNPHHSKQMQSTHQTQPIKASNISSNCDNNQIPLQQPELKAAGFEKRGISYERPSILSKQPSQNAFLMNSAAQNCLSRNTASTASLPPCTSSSSAFKLSESANSNSASEQSGKQALNSRSAGLNTSAKNEGSTKSFHVNTSAFESGAITSTLLQAAQQSSTLGINQHQNNQQSLGQSEVSSASERHQHLSSFSPQCTLNQPVIENNHQNVQEFTQTIQKNQYQSNQQYKDISSISTNNEKCQVLPFASSLQSDFSNPNNNQNLGREKDYIYNYSAIERSPVSVISSNQHNESALRSSSKNHKSSSSKPNNVMTFGENEYLNTQEDKYTAKKQLQHLLIQNPSPQKNARTFKPTCSENNRPSPTRELPQNLAQSSQFGINNSKNCFQEGSHPHSSNINRICEDCSLRQHSQDHGASQFSNESTQNRKTINTKQAKVDEYSSKVQELIPQLVTALKSMEYKSGDVERFLDSQERQIEGGFQQLISHLTTVKDQLLKTIDNCRAEKRRRYNEINKLCSKSLEDMVNSQQDIQMNYEKIVTEFEESQVNLVMQSYNDRQQEAWKILIRSRGAELLEVLKFDASTLSSLQDSIGFTALTSLKRLRTTFVKQNNNNNSQSSNLSPSGSPIGSRSNSKSTQKQIQKQISPFRSRKSNLENQKRTPNKQLFNSNAINDSHYNNHNNSVNISHCSHGGSISNNSHNNSSFFQNLEASFIQNQQDKAIAQIQQECYVNDKGRVVQRQNSAQSRVTQGTSVYVSFDNQEAFKIPQDIENKENAFTIANGTIPEYKQIYNERPSYSNNQQGKIPIMRANFQIPIQEIKNRNFFKDTINTIQKESSQEFNNNLHNQGIQGAQKSQLNMIAAEMGSQKNRFLINLNNTRNTKESAQFRNQDRNSAHMEEVIEEEDKQNSTPTETARLFNETQGKQGQKDACTPDFAQVASSSESLQYGQQVQVGSLHSSKESKLSNRASFSEQQAQKPNKFNEMIKAVQANQIQRNQNCQTILQRVSDSIRDSSSAQSSIQGGQSHNRSGSTQTSSITAVSSTTRCERASSSHVKLESDAQQLKFSLEELLYRPSVDSLNPALQKEVVRYHVPIEEESEKGFNILGETQSSGCKSTVEYGNSKEKPRQFYMPFVNPIDY